MLWFVKYHKLISFQSSLFVLKTWERPKNPPTPQAGGTKESRRSKAAITEKDIRQQLVIVYACNKIQSYNNQIKIE